MAKRSPDVALTLRNDSARSIYVSKDFHTRPVVHHLRGRDQTGGGLGGFLLVALGLAAAVAIYLSGIRLWRRRSHAVRDSRRVGTDHSGLLSGFRTVGRAGQAPGVATASDRRRGGRRGFARRPRVVSLT